ncbi:tRNA dihydrouridine synthase DusB [Solemya velum gill symbiont]|uniref:tRNA dihydrouridine synthase DusB n=1 Tax=Solemya velum gill symbiont TaxID=2340 RepID=UPI0009960FB3|nr:tRNA dihydrouridine synthase DusB [Solemya velum gill symbiont]OOZ00560.1 tRNA dihydrouridine synthase DusB [Solemya velum gill symbiont]OOZ02682.1 tRNA dihydrouridine synthase DusB [Solemya velum gill symbiont]OOZ04858.1 tRNA dihydrouridine synthase DusB [Solemya velum gill symbiont]OOZ07099.1 tRNA dihydrouridine synthase DusB [Solemya velum gill symbiont]OOZ09282.1 tRNA dihydrouridine synthase DusB [Solemya velum gill symbiont]
MQIGSHRFDKPLILAPMAGVTDRPFRQLCRRLGADLAVSEMVTADTSLWGSKKTLSRLNHAGEQGPRWVQIVGADPDKMAQAARINADLGADIIDINMGCPAKKVCKVAAGSALMRDELLVGKILEAVVGASEQPVTLKIRTGWDHSSKNAEQIARIAETAGITALSIHGRTRADKFAGEAEYSTIRKVKQCVGIPVIANGDIDSPQKARKVLEETQADALMIGRAAQGRPWVFGEMRHFLDTGQELPPMPTDKIAAFLLEHLEQLYSFYGAEHGVRIARKHIGWYSRSQQDAGRFRDAVFKTTSPADQKRVVQEYFNNIGQQTRVLKGAARAA